MVSLYDTWAHQPLYWTSAGAGNPCMALDFGCNAPLTITGLRYWFDGTHNNRPERLILFDKNSGAMLARLVPNAGQTSGWVTTNLLSALNIPAGSSLQVLYDAPLNQAMPFTDNVTVAPAPLLFGDNRLYNSQSIDNPTSPMTGSSATGSGALIDVVVTTGTPTPPPATSQDVADNLAAWLSAQTPPQAHAVDGLPVLTKQELDNVQQQVTFSYGRSTGLQGLSDQLAAALQRMSDWLAGGGSAPYPSAVKKADGTTAMQELDQALADHTAILDAINAISVQIGDGWRRTQTTNWLVPVPGEGWVLQDTLDWSGNVAWSVPADCYVNHITSYPITTDQVVVAGYLWLPRAYWWAPLTGTLPHERHFGDQEFQILHALPMRCQGILLAPRTGFAGTIEAWTRD